jgi:hypothetical protein
MGDPYFLNHNGERLPAPTPIMGEIVSAPSYPMCLSCVSEYILARNKWIESGQPDGEEPNYNTEVNPAVTEAPSWQSQAMGGQMVVACVPLPTCMKHLGVREKTAMEKAAGSGLMVPGSLS